MFFIIWTTLIFIPGIFIDGKLFAVSDEHPDVTYFASIQIRTDDVMLEFDRERE